MTALRVAASMLGPLLVAAPSAVGEPDGGWYDGMATDTSIIVGGGTSPRDVSPAVQVHGGDDAPYIYSRRPQRFCGTADSGPGRVPCVEGAPSGHVVRLCADGTEASDPMQRREVDPATGHLIGLWERVDDGGCPEDPPAPVIILSTEEFRRLALVASVPQLQPADGRGLVNKDLIAYTDPAPQSLQTVVLGVPVAVRATPASYSWEFGDGSAPLVTTDPGAVWPNHTVAHPYGRAGTYQVLLTTTWTGEFQVDGAGPWLPVAGTATTTSAPFPALVEEAPSVLVAGGG